MRELHELIETCKIVNDEQSKIDLAIYLVGCQRKGTLTDEYIMQLREECKLTSAVWIYAEVVDRKAQDVFDSIRKGE